MSFKFAVAKIFHEEWNIDITDWVHEPLDANNIEKLYTIESLLEKSGQVVGVEIIRDLMANEYTIEVSYFHESTGDVETKDTFYQIERLRQIFPELITELIFKVKNKHVQNQLSNST